MPASELLSSTEAARIKGVSRQAIYKAAERGALTVERIGRVIVVVRDERFEAYRPQPYRGRSRRRDR